MRILVALLLLALIFAFPQGVGAAESDKLTIFFYEIGDDGEDVISSYIIAIPPHLSVEARAMLIFSEIFDNANSDKMIYAPRDVRILDVFFHREYAHLVLNLSSEVMNYGGTHFEWQFVRKLIANAASIREVGYLSVLVDGQRRYLPEGTKIHEIRVYDGLWH